jgi:DNA-directed RNA polymerase specialized sigma24 family protein
MSIAEDAARSASVENFPEFAYRVVQAGVLDERRRIVRANKGGDDMPAEVTRRDVDASLEVLSLAISCLSRVQYRAVKLRYQDGLSLAGVSAALGVSQATVWRSLYAAKEYLLAAVNRPSAL